MRRRDLLLVDGYNVMHAWPELDELMDNLEFARDRLTDLLAEYGAFRGLAVVLVFDAHSRPGSLQRKEQKEGVEVIYTAEGETADTVIERMAYLSVRQGRTVYVVTSDRDEQMLVLGTGAYRIPARELCRQVADAKKEIRRKTEERNGRRELGSRLDDSVYRRLDELRRR